MRDDRHGQGGTAGEQLEARLRRFFVYVTTERPVVLDLLVVEEADTSEIKISTRKRLITAGRPLIIAAQEAHDVRRDLDLDQVLDLVMAVAKIPGAPPYRQPVFDAALAGLRSSG